MVIISLPKNRQQEEAQFVVMVAWSALKPHNSAKWWSLQGAEGTLHCRTVGQVQSAIRSVQWNYRTNHALVEGASAGDRNTCVVKIHSLLQYSNTMVSLNFPKRAANEIGKAPTF